MKITEKEAERFIHRLEQEVLFTRLRKLAKNIKTETLKELCEVYNGTFHSVNSLFNKPSSINVENTVIRKEPKDNLSEGAKEVINLIVVLEKTSKHNPTSKKPWKRTIRRKLLKRGWDFHMVNKVFRELSRYAMELN